MKNKIFAAIIVSLISIALVTSSFATKPKHSTATKEIAILAPFTKIVVGNHINVVLVQDPYRLTVSVTGDEKSVSYVQTNIVNNQLTIFAKKNVEGKKITVYIPVENLSTIKLSAGSSVSAEGILKFPDLTVRMSTGCRAALNVLGKINITSNGDCDFVYEKNEISTVIAEILQHN